MPIRCAGRPAEVAVDQIRGIDRSRVGTRLGVVGEAEAAMLRRVITEMYGE